MLSYGVLSAEILEFSFRFFFNSLEHKIEQEFEGSSFKSKQLEQTFKKIPLERVGISSMYCMFLPHTVDFSDYILVLKAIL